MSISKKKKIAFVFAVILICFIVFAGYKAYRQLKSTVLPGYLALSENTVISLEFKNYTSIMEEFTEKNEIWIGLKQSALIDTFGIFLRQFDSVAKAEQNLKDLLAESKIYIALQKTGKKYDILFVAEMPRGNHENIIEGFIRKINGDKSIVLDEDYKKARLITANIPSLNKMLRYSIHKGLFICSFNKALIQGAIDETEKKQHFFEMPVLAKLRLTGGKKVNANLYFNYQLLSGIATINTHHDFMSQVAGLAEFAGFAGLDMILTEDEILLNGYTIPNDSLNEFLNTFKQDPQIVRVTEILPSGTYVLLDFGIADFAKWSENYFNFQAKSKVSKKLADLRKKIEQEYQVDFSGIFSSIAGNEAALAMVRYDEFPLQSQKLAVLNCSSIKDAELILDSLSNLVAKKQKTKPFFFRFDDYIIRSIPVEGLLQSQLGSFFESFGKNFYVPIKDYIVFAENPEILVRIINDYYNHLTLSENKRFKGFSNNISDKSNILLYLGNRVDFSYLNHYISENFANELGANKSIPENIDAIALQYSYLNKIFYTNLYLKYSGKKIIEHFADHETELQAEITGKPYIVNNPETGKESILVFDKNNTLYFIDDNGQIVWQKNLPEPALSDIFEIDYFGDGKKQFLFNTVSSLYIFDSKGEFIENFPVPLKSRASNGISVFDYDRNKEYRIIVAGEDNRIYNYNIKGENIEGWDKIRTNSVINSPVRHIVASGKDYMIVREETGNIIITNRRGENRISIPSKVFSAAGTNFYPNRTNNKGPIIFTDTKGILTYVDPSGKISTSDFGSFSSSHYFFYEDFNMDGSYDFIYADKNKISVFTRMKEILLSKELSFNITYPPQVLVNGKKVIIVTIDPVRSNISLYNKDGQLFPGRTFRGNKPVVISNLKKDGTNYMITGESNKVYIYRLN